MLLQKEGTLYGTDLFGFEIRLGHKQTQQTPKKIGEGGAEMSNGAAGFFHGYSEASGRPIWFLLRLLGG